MGLQLSSFNRQSINRCENKIESARLSLNAHMINYSSLVEGEKLSDFLKAPYGFIPPGENLYQIN